jgi:phosphate-selective porin OprO/OprP
MIATTWLLLPASAHAQQTSRTSATSQEPDPRTVWRDYPTFFLGEGSRIEIHARLQTDYLLRDDSEPDATAFTIDDRFSIARKRVAVEGVLFERLEFQVEREIGDTQPWRDVFADLRMSRALRIRAGRFKVPFSLEQLTRGTDLDFITRAQAVSDLAPARDIGVLLHGRVARKGVKYEAGLFETDAATRLWATDSVLTLAARVTVAPLADGKWRGSDALEFAAAVLRSDQPEGRTGPSGHLVMGDTFFHHMFVNGSRTRLGTSGSWNARRLSVRGELLRSIDTRIGQAIDGGDLSNLVSTGGYVSGLVHLVPGRGRRRGDFPLRALDVGARLDRLSFGSSAHGDQAFLNPRADVVAPVAKDAWTLGVNWYPNRWVKIQANAVREQIVDPLALTTSSAMPLWSTVLRCQVAM